MLSDLLNQLVVIKVATYANVRGVRTPSYTETTTTASVQPMTAAQADAHGLEMAAQPHMCYLASDPDVKAGDRIAWGLKELEIVGPAADQAGRGQCWAVPGVLKG